MLHSIPFSSFDDTTRQAQYVAVKAALEAEATSSPTLLLSNFEVEGEVVDALVVRPHSITVLLFVPEGGLLDIPNQQDGAWQLGSYTLHGDEYAANPFEQFLRQQEAVAKWLNAHLTPAQVQPELITGLVLFAGSVQFGPGVETYLRRQPGAENFQLLSALNQLPRRLRQLSNPEISLPPDALLTWAQTLSTTPATSYPSDAPEPDGTSYWEDKARKLWRWLGAEDIPHDAPYGSTAEAVAASEQEMHRLEQLSQQVRAELAQQRQEMEAREAERERSIEQLRAQLTQAPGPAAEVAALQARLAAETQEKNRLEEAIRAAQQESAVRNQELDARIQQLSHLIQQLQRQPEPVAAAAPAAPVARATPPASAPAKPTVRNTAVPPTRPAAANLLPRDSWRIKWPRVLLVILGICGIGGAVWGVAHFVSNRLASAPTTTRQAPKEEPNAEDETAQAPSLSDIQPDTLLVEDEPIPTPDPANNPASTPAATPSDSTDQDAGLYETDEEGSDADPTDSAAIEEQVPGR
ncbi:hypothetical protein DNI29_12320 [Hymenobacter sediminis]|uniref:hypothetical protein n=1 Tax=Hymenobacter sediminis TaxID=2218621 RepID=UPI000DA643C2|nr:hypothetical protein [Hymenobacter sediminis]RPD46939.1 hypothetical protein DNI29_12320 [Hymenobacter sediminis]